MSLKLLELKKQLKRKQKKLKHYDKALNARHHVQRTLSRQASLENEFSIDEFSHLKLPGKQVAISDKPQTKTVTFKEGSPEILYVGPLENSQQNPDSFNNFTTPKSKNPKVLNDIKSPRIQDLNIEPILDLDSECVDQCKRFCPENVQAKHPFSSTSLKNCNTSQVIEDVFSEAFDMQAPKDEAESPNDLDGVASLSCDYFIDARLESRGILASVACFPRGCPSLFTVTESCFTLWPLDLDRKCVSNQISLLKTISLDNPHIRRRVSSSRTIQVHSLSPAEEESSCFLVLLSPTSCDGHPMVILARYTSSSSHLAWTLIPEILLCNDCLFLSSFPARWSGALYLNSCANCSCQNFPSRPGQLWRVDYDLIFSQKEERWKVPCDVHKIYAYADAPVTSLSFLRRDLIEQEGCYVFMDANNALHLIDAASHEEILSMDGLFKVSTERKPRLIWSAILKSMMLLLFKMEAYIVGVLVNPLGEKHEIFCRWKLPEEICADWSNSACTVIFYSGQFVVCVKEAVICLPCS